MYIFTKFLQKYVTNFNEEMWKIWNISIDKKLTIYIRDFSIKVFD